MELLTALFRLAPALMVAVALLCAPASARGLKDYQRIAWTPQQEAPGNITGLAQTTDGWLWVGSDDGLLRFDGVNFEPYLPAGRQDVVRARGRHACRGQWSACASALRALAHRWTFGASLHAAPQSPLASHWSRQKSHLRTEYARRIGLTGWTERPACLFRPQNQRIRSSYFARMFWRAALRIR